MYLSTMGESNEQLKWKGMDEQVVRYIVVSPKIQVGEQRKEEKIYN